MLPPSARVLRKRWRAAGCCAEETFASLGVRGSLARNSTLHADLKCLGTCHALRYLRYEQALHLELSQSRSEAVAAMPLGGGARLCCISYRPGRCKHNCRYGVSSSQRYSHSRSTTSIFSRCSSSSTSSAPDILCSCLSVWAAHLHLRYLRCGHHLSLLCLGLPIGCLPTFLALLPTPGARPCCSCRSCSKRGHTDISSSRRLQAAQPHLRQGAGRRPISSGEPGGGAVAKIPLIWPFLELIRAHTAPFTAPSGAQAASGLGEARAGGRIVPGCSPRPLWLPAGRRARASA